MQKEKITDINEVGILFLKVFVWIFLLIKYLSVYERRKTTFNPLSTMTRVHIHSGYYLVIYTASETHVGALG
ncbi:hypothetical protein E2C01_049799 [Portunus trituberculatus]|uniref:Uncharacterized protein n=1 Tax=Portunus trituberculatus TaxID=210409 RepID=A0A5B7GET7_PORTR|nr:hypothetical protein [Portunus trituberculatus]